MRYCFKRRKEIAKIRWYTVTIEITRKMFELLKQDRGCQNVELANRVSIYISQKVLNDLSRTMFSRCHMVWLLPHPIPLAPSAIYLSFSIFLCVAGRAYLWEKGRLVDEPIIRRRESLVAYKSFITL